MAAIAAAEEGAKVIVAEKANSKRSGPALPETIIFSVIFRQSMGMIRLNLSGRWRSHRSAEIMIWISFDDT